MEKSRDNLMFNFGLIMKKNQTNQNLAAFYLERTFQKHHYLVRKKKNGEEGLFSVPN